MFERRLARIHNVADFRLAAKRVLPRMVFDYIDGGADSESTVRENRAALDRIRLVPTALTDVRERSSAIDLFGTPCPLPIIIGPTGFASSFWPKGELEIARAAARHGIPFNMSSGAGVSIDEVSKAMGDGRKWFQMYLPRDRAATRRWVDMVRDHAFEAIEVTVDSQVPGNRIRDLHNGFIRPFQWTPRKVLGVAIHPEWALRMLPHGMPTSNLAADGEAGRRPDEGAAGSVRARLNPGVTWDEIKWVRDQWQGKLLVKGVTDPALVPAAIAAGLDGVVVSNHGGRQVDGTIATMDVLPEFTAQAAGRLTVLVDSGFRQGADFLKARALGAAAVQIGRATAWSCSAAGEEGVSRMLDLLAKEIDTTLALIGVADIKRLGPERVRWLAPGAAKAPA